MTEHTPPRGPGPAAEWFRRCPDCLSSGRVSYRRHPDGRTDREHPTPAHRRSMGPTAERCQTCGGVGFVPAADPDRAELRDAIAKAIYQTWCALNGVVEREWPHGAGVRKPLAYWYEYADNLLALIPPGDGLAGLLRRAMRGGLIVRFWPLVRGTVRCVVADNRSLDEGDWREWDANGDTPEAALESALRAAEQRAEGGG